MDSWSMGTCSYTWEEWDEEKGEIVEKRCQKETWEGSDEFCIFHDPSPEKDVDLFKEKLEEQMKSETERHNFIGYYFPEHWGFSGKEFKIDANFGGATFLYVYFGRATFQGTAYFWGATFQNADFGRATFKGDADFEGATFKGTTNFHETTFQGDADFRETTFQGTTNFGGATFQNASFWGATFQYASFWGATFQGNANFEGATIQGNADFEGATIQDADFRGATIQYADFEGAIFQGTANFSGATFQNAYFSGATFQGTANFREAIFQGTANFSGATFQNASFWGATFQDASFWGAIFQGTANFREAIFQGTADFREATFQYADFRGATFQGTADFEGATFQYADFEGATFQYADFEGATFQGTTSFWGATFNKKAELVLKNVGTLDLRNTEFLSRSYITADFTKALFYQSFIEHVAFNNCTWPKRTSLYEEIHKNEEDIDLSYKELETIYRDLKQNMQNHGDYDTAGKLYYREMEMKRKGTTNWKKRIWLNVYRVVGGYGESPLHTAGVSGLIVMLFALGYGLSGCLQYTAQNPCLYQQIKDSIYFSFVTFTTLGLGDISPLNDLGKVLICFEAVIGAFLIALFVVVFARKMIR